MTSVSSSLCCFIPVVVMSSSFIGSTVLSSNEATRGRGSSHGNQSELKSTFYTLLAVILYFQFTIGCVKIAMVMNTLKYYTRNNFDKK